MNSCLMWARTFFFFFQAEDGIRDSSVTGVQTCALPISYASLHRRSIRATACLGQRVGRDLLAGCQGRAQALLLLLRASDKNRIGAERLDRGDKRRGRTTLGDPLARPADLAPAPAFPPPPPHKTALYLT